MPWITKEGRTVDEARDAAVSAAGVPEAELEIEVVAEGAKGLFGLGGEPAIVRVRPREEATDFRHAFRDDITPGGDEVAPERVFPAQGPADTRDRVPAPTEREPRRQRQARDEAAAAEVEDDDADAFEGERLPPAEQQEQAAALGAEIIKGILERMGLDGDVNTRVAGGTVYIEVFGEEMGILIGRGGGTLEALQELVRAGVQRRLKTRQALVVDVEAYWERRRQPGGGRDEAREGGRQREGGRGRRGPRRRPRDRD